MLAKETKQAFLTELSKTSNQSQKGKASSNFSKNNSKDEDEPGWAPLRESYMLGSKLKDWDKMQVKPPDLALFALGDTGNSFA